MKQLIVAIGLALGILAGTIASAETPNDDNTLLWKIEGNGIKTSYVYGTFHLLPQKDFHISDEAKKAIEASDQFVMELDMDDLYNLFFDYCETEKEVELMLHSRDANWIEPFKNYATQKSSFIAVGAEHLGGDKGVIQLLKNKGFMVTAVN